MANRLSGKYRELLELQRGVIARWQLVRGSAELASSPNGGEASAPGGDDAGAEVGAEVARDIAAVDGLLRRGRWSTLYRGAYLADDGTAPREAVLWAAALRCGPDAALSHFTAAELDSICDVRSDALHVTVGRHARIRFAETEFAGGVPRIVLHRSSRISSARHPVRMPPRTQVQETVIDLTDLADRFDVAFGWLSAACARRLVTPDQLRAAVRGRSRMRWRDQVLGALELISEGVSSNLELQHVRKVERPHRLPQPKRQVRMRRGARSSAYLNNFYEDFAVGVELDGLGAHPAETRWQDIHRDNHFATAGIITLRYSWADVTQRPCEVAAEIAQVLRQRGWTGTIRPCQATCPAATPWRDRGR